MKANYSDTHRDIIEDCKRGNQKAQYRLYQLYNKAMFNICLRMMNTREEAEDILQEAFSEAFLQLHTFRYESSFGAWLKRIVVNRCINALKKRRAKLVLTDEMQDVAIEPNEISDDGMKLSVKKILNAVSKLADGYRVIFTLYMLEGYDHAEIGEILNISESTSKSQYMRAKAKLREMLADKI